MSCRNAHRLNQIVSAFLDRHKLLDPNPSWLIQESSLGGFGVFATRDIEAGEVIFQDFPVILGPRCLPNGPRVCVVCYSNKTLGPCKRVCGLDVCGEECQNSLAHRKECELVRQCSPPGIRIFENLTPIRSLLLDENDKEVVNCLIAHDRDEHGHEVTTLKKLGCQFKEDDEKFMRFVCCVLDANAFEVALEQNNIRGLYPLASLGNHSCAPNSTYVFNKSHHMLVKASLFIPKGSEIFYSYTRLIWGTPSRLYHLYRTKHFVCKCSRCRDPTEFGTYMGGILCKICRGIVVPLNPYKTHARWQCQDCKRVILGKETGELLRLLGVILRDIRQDDFPFMYKFLNGKLRSVVPENNQVAVQVKYKIIKVLGHLYPWNELTEEMLKIKETLCLDLLGLLEQLRCGKSKMRGLLLYELFCCKRESNTRASKGILDPETEGLLKEAASILEYDANAPQEIKCYLDNKTV
ncbi:SET domain-containing protein SmydA-8-like [Anthonomus grandis grandis]|uniref:SET domain-containing protein SmydA-8-like n=1 Tax=Anthonomus grandis grandis TaxID=2921223 RepID=UPI0021659F33|nr:SET domain-containing protein SmydA-8-like [Anthonomus grandis grandis]